MAFEPSPRVEPSLLVGESPALREVRRRIELVAPTESSVLLLGETGTGKGLAAREIHARSPRAGGAFVHVDCAALSPSLIESELFGHERGAFTGAVESRAGRLELARGGTLFLDEIGELEPSLQAKLLRVLHDRRFERVGGARALALEARVLAATCRDLRADVRAGRFRRDLYFRLCVLPIEIPPLRVRLEDLPLLARARLPALAQRVGRALPRALPCFYAALARHDWPGNVRELENALERALLLAPGELLDEVAAVAALEAGRLAGVEERGRATRESSADEPGAGPWRAPCAGDPNHPRDRIAAALRSTGGNVSRAARRLGLARSTLRWHIQRHGLQALIPND